MTSNRTSYPVASGAISAVHFGDMAQPVQLVMLHANGFNAYSYKSLLEPLGVHAIALDLRGHGYSTGFDLKPDALRNFYPFADDVSAFLRAYIKAPVLMVGHSLGGVVGAIAARDNPETVRGYLGLDPVTVPTLVRALPYIPGGGYLLKNGFDWAKKAGKRRTRFDSLEAAFTHYNGRGTFKFLDDAVVRHYLEGGLIEIADGVELSCPPLWEQAVYGAQAQNVFKIAKGLPDNSRYVFAGVKPASTAGTRAQMGRAIGKGKVEFHKELSHFFPLIEQDMTRDYIRTALAAS